jgi:hypothetical protein
MPFVDGVRPEHRVNEIPHELLFQIIDVDLVGARSQRLLADRGEFVPLPQIG